ncbi:MAG: hypothetical protein HY812_05055 [Planctomycetes bacterium]|nr:hypothetical protein [Planctomycetota bacterium]
MVVDRTILKDGTFEVVDSRTGATYRVECTGRSLDLLSVLVQGGRFVVRRLPGGAGRRALCSRPALRWRAT